LGGIRRLAAGDLPDEVDDLLDLLGVALGEFPPADVEAVLEADADVPTDADRLEAELELVSARPDHRKGVVVPEELLGGGDEVGEVVRVGRYQLKVEELDGPRISKLTVSRWPEEQREPGLE
jgi:CBS domain containing-hemolysin-like protein